MGQKSLKPARKKAGKPSTAPPGSQGRQNGVEHPLAPLAGIFKEDPLWDEFMEAIRRARAAEDAEADVCG